MRATLTLEVANVAGAAQVVCKRGASAAWRDQLRGSAMTAAGNTRFSAVALHNGSLQVSFGVATGTIGRHSGRRSAARTVCTRGSIHCMLSTQVYSAAGRQLLPNIALGSVPRYLAAGAAWQLMAVCADASVRLWDLQTERLLVRASLSALRGAEGESLGSSPACRPLIEEVLRSRDMRVQWWVRG